MKWAIGFALGFAAAFVVMALSPHPAVEPVAAAAGTPSGNGDVNGSGLIDLADAICLLSYLFSEGPAPEPIVCGAGGLPATGQETCYDSSRNVIDCASADFPGQDGFYRSGCPKEGRYVDNGDGTVSDTCTGLVWQKDRADVNGDGAITDQDVVTWQDALKYCDGLVFAGRDDWRLPNIRELQSIVDYSRTDPAIDPVFGAVSSHWSWASSTYVRAPGAAWFVDFGGGGGSSADKDGRYCVRAVRVGP
ncbi:MAG: DUF1566 domain-containing protein [Planctomycetes bacterium]|nr:DUF1566 domain-containing protein [Planctomycetota bacterium]